jgi:hypothetical protein
LYILQWTTTITGFVEVLRSAVTHSSLIGCQLKTGQLPDLFFICIFIYYLNDINTRITVLRLYKIFVIELLCSIIRDWVQNGLAVEILYFILKILPRSIQFFAIGNLYKGRHYIGMVKIMLYTCSSIYALMPLK